MPIIHLTEKEVAARLRVTTRTLRKWRADGTGIPCMGLGSDGQTYRYREQDVEAYELGHIVHKDIPADARHAMLRAAQAFEIILRWQMRDDARGLIASVRDELRGLITAKKEGP